MNANAPVRTIAVVGGGVVALSAAVTFARALPGVAITLVPTAVEPAALADQFPMLHAEALGAVERWGESEHDLLAAGCARPLLADRFDGWSADGAPWLGAPGSAAAAVGMPGLVHQQWLHAAAANADVPRFHDLFAAVAMARAGRFAPDPPAPLVGAGFHLRFDAGLLSDALLRRSVPAGVALARGGIRAVEPGPNGIGALRLDDAERIAADLFVDASGPAALLADTVSPAVESWAAWLPDRLLVGAGAPSPGLLDHYERLDGGWRAAWPGPRRTLHAIAGFPPVNGNAARGALPAGIAAARPVALRPGRRRRFWSGNCLAIGEAAVQPGPLGLAGFSLAQALLALALELFPGRELPPPLLAEYNRRAALRADRLRDRLIAHDIGSVPRPASLAATLAQFAQRGHLSHHDEDDVPPDRWHAMLIGQGMRPRRADPIAMGADPRMLARALRNTADALAVAAARLPPI